YLASGIVPTLTIAPTDTTVDENTSVTFFSQGYGTATLTYQWYQSVDGGATFQILNGQTSPNLTLNNVSQSQSNYRYEVVVANSYGSITSTPVTLTVLFGAPTITSDLLPNYYVSYSLPLTLSVGVGGSAPFTYGWWFNGAPLSDGGGISGSHNSTLSIASTLISQSGNYQLFVTNGSGTTNSVIAA